MHLYTKINIFVSGDDEDICQFLANSEKFIFSRHHRNVLVKSQSQEEEVILCPVIGNVNLPKDASDAPHTGLKVIVDRGIC